MRIGALRPAPTSAKGSWINTAEAEVASSATPTLNPFSLPVWRKVMLASGMQVLPPSRQRRRSEPPARPTSYVSASHLTSSLAFAFTAGITSV